jgi:Repeat of Unknown Function (DUF347)
MKPNALTLSFQDSPLRHEVNSAITNRSWATTSKVPEVAIAFWIIKIAATTLGETAGDALSMSMNLGYLLSTVHIHGLLCRSACGPGQGEGVSSFSLLDRDCHHNDGGHDHGR